MTFDSMDDAKLQVYAATVLKIGQATPTVVDLRQPVDELLQRRLCERSTDRFTVITAENPGGTTISDNPARTRRLAEVLHEKQLSAVPALGRNPEGTHREHGFAVAGDLEPVLELARAFDQDAVFRFENGAFTLVDALTLRRYRLPPGDLTHRR